MVHSRNFLIKRMKAWSVISLSSFSYQTETSGPRKQRQRDPLAEMVVLVLLSSLCCPLHAQNLTDDDYITSDTNVTTPETRVFISAPYAIFSRSLYVFTTGIPIQPVYIQAPSGLDVWLTIQCRGGAARVTVPNYVANYTLVQTDPTGEWILPSLPLNDSWPVTGLGIKFNQNVSIANDALDTLLYGKGADNDIAGKATMTITLNWNATSATTNRVVVLTKSKSIFIWAPTALTSLSTFQATVAGVCIVGIFGLCCIGCLNSVGVTYLRRYNVLMARETRDQQECEQNRVFNPMWMPCAPSQSGYYNIQSTPSLLMLVQRRMEIKSLILRTPTTFSLMDRLTRVKYLKSSNYGWFGCQPLWAAAPPRRPLNSSSDDEFSAGIPKAALRVSQLQASQSREVSMVRQQPGAATSTQHPPNYSQHGAPPYDWQQAQAVVYNTQNRMYPGATNYVQQTAQPVPAMYPGNQYGRGQGPGAQGNLVNYETITVGFAFIHHRLAQNVPTDAEPASARTVSAKEIPGPGHHSLCGSRAGHSDLSGKMAQHRKGKELTRLDSSLEQFRPGYEDRILHTIPPRVSLKPVSKLGSHHCQLVEEIVTKSLESRSVRYEGGVSELHQDAFPREELPAERGSEESDRASESFGSPLSDLFEDVLESCSLTNSIPGRIDGRCRTESPLPLIQQAP